MAEQQRTRSAKQSAEPNGSGTKPAAASGPKVAPVASMSTPIFDELLREMAARGGQANNADRHAKPVESKHRAP